MSERKIKSIITFEDKPITLHYTWDGQVLNLDDVTGDEPHVHKVPDDWIEAECHDVQNILIYGHPDISLFGIYPDT